jgi:M6 family metalloprotease-like protein
MSFKQPDGTFVDVRLYGDEYYMRAEGLDGFTLVRDKNTHWICYAVLSDDSAELVPSGIVYNSRTGDPSSLKSTLSIPKHIDISGKAREKVIANSRGLRNGYLSEEPISKKAPHAVSGIIKGLCILVDFSDEPATMPVSEFTYFLNDLNYSNYGNNGSLRTYYSDISGGRVDYQNVVYGYYRAPLTFAEYDQMSDQSNAIQQVLAWALNKLDLEGFDFSTLSINPDGSIVAINLIYTGIAQNWAHGLWWSQGYYPDFHADGVHSGLYNTSPATEPLQMGTVVHENGHMIGGWPDTYKYTTDNGTDGIGAFDVMCNIGDYCNPVPPNPLFRSDAGWGKVIDITNYNGSVSDTANSLTCYKYHINNSDEYFLFESRKKTGRSASIPDEGLTIWHIDRTGDNQTTHHEVFLEHANNNREDHTQACFHDGFNNAYGLSTTPGSGFYNGDPSGLQVRDISVVSDVMTYKLGVADTSPALQLSFQNLSGDNNGNGFLEPGESGNINILAGNGGQLSSGNATVVCNAMGSNAGYVTVNTPVVNAGVIDVSQTVSVTHNVTIHAETPVGTLIDLRFTVSDGTDSTYFTRTFIIGQQILMDDQQIATCSAIFYDRGGAFSNYENMTDYTASISSPSGNLPIRVEFLTFELEAEATCGYDYLNIYDGSSTSSPLIGTFCGTNSPGTITSTDPSGSLTFQFHSDVGWRYAGWSAKVNCVVTNSLPEVSMPETFTLFPNPANGIINVSRNTGSAAEISITDLLGREVYRVASFSGEHLTINLTGKPDGIYLLYLKTQSETLVEKIIIINRYL